MQKKSNDYDLGKVLIDYHKFADFVGYEMPLRSNKLELRRTFYRQLLKYIGSNI